MSDLECSICLEAFNTSTKTPLVLACGHSFCSECLIGLFHESFTCPFDRKEEWRPAKNLPKNYLLLDFLKKSSQQAPKCVLHDKKLKWKCLTDNETICSDCILNHNSHNLSKLENEEIVIVDEESKVKSKNVAKISFNPELNLKIYQSCIWPEGSFGDLQSLIMPPKSRPENTKLLYSLTKHNGSNQIFHKLCDNKGPTITLVQLTDGNIFGGFTKVSWKKQSNERGNNVRDDKAYLFKVGNEQKRKKFPIKMQYSSMAVFHHFEAGPTFGVGYDLHLNLDDLNSCCSRLEAYSTAKSEKGIYSLAGKFNRWDIKEIEVYLIAV